MLAAVPLGIGIAEATSEHRNLLSNAWVVGSLIFEAVAGLAFLWSIVLYLAHRHAATAHEPCPDLSAHQELSAAQKNAAELRKALVLLQLDLEAASGLVSAAIQSGYYWTVSDATKLPEQNWAKYREFLSAQEGFQETCRDLDLAFRHISKVNRSRRMRVMAAGFTTKGWQVQPGDQLDRLLENIKRAHESVSAQITEPVIMQSGETRFFGLKLGGIGLGFYRIGSK